MLSWPRSIGLWAAAFFTLGIFSFLYGDNPVYKIAEAVLVGVSAAYWIVRLNARSRPSGHFGCHDLHHTFTAVMIPFGKISSGAACRRAMIDSYFYGVVVRVGSVDRHDAGCGVETDVSHGDCRRRLGNRSASRGIATGR